MLVIFILLILSGLIFLGSAVNSDEVGGFLLGISFCLVSLIAIGVGVSIWYEPKELHPTPMDVYRGKTTLEITYRDSIAIDSVVVWREE